MRAYVDNRSVDVGFDLVVRFRVDLQPGVWVVREADGCDYAVTKLSGLLDADGRPHLSYCHGVARRPSGIWAAREQVLLQAVPRNNPTDCWTAIPAAVRTFVEDAYLLARDDLPEGVAP